MLREPQRIRPFIGAHDFDRSREFYGELGFHETEISRQMSVFQLGDVSFYLQRYYVKDWVDNTMLFLEVPDLDAQHSVILRNGIVDRFQGVRVSAIQDNAWGREFFLHDPSGILWHIGTFAT